LPKSKAILEADPLKLTTRRIQSRSGL